MGGSCGRQGGVATARRRRGRPGRPPPPPHPPAPPTPPADPRTRQAVADAILHPEESLSSVARRHGMVRQTLHAALRRLAAEPRPRSRASGKRRRQVRVHGAQVTLWLSDEQHAAMRAAATGSGGIGPWLEGLLESHPARGPLATHLRRIGLLAARIHVE